jgi:CheY-like chemotaxis protein/HPt (histidine-containing phosphotransfer) domain-containing protein
MVEQSNSARQEAEIANRAKSTFLANMSHEIRTPLTSIIGFSESLLEAELPDQERIDSINTIHRCGKHLLSIISDVLDLSKIEEDKLDIESIPVSLFDLLNEVQQVMELQAKDKQLEFSIIYEFPLPKTIQSDPLRIKQILLNLINNAIKFTAKGSVTLHVQVKRPSELIYFEVQDTGIGISLEQQKNLFKPFTQADVSTTRQFGGTGLGLYLSKSLANKLSGDIRLTSQANVGSCFTVSIATGALSDDLFVDEVPTLIKQDIATSGGALLGSKTPKVLVVDDIRDNQSLISLYLNRMGIEPTIATNGLEAIEVASNGDFDLVLMDIQMPVLNGIDATKRLRAIQYKKPIIALTANVMKSDLALYKEAGFDDTLAKPLEKDKFIKVISKYANLPESETIGQHVAEQRLASSSDMDDSHIYSTLDTNNDEEIKQLIMSYVEGLRSQIEVINTAIASQSWSDLKTNLHSLKGTSGSFGFNELSDATKEAYALVLKEQYDQLTPRILSIEGISKRIISTYLPDKCDASSDRSNPDDKDTRQLKAQ